MRHKCKYKIFIVWLDQLLVRRCQAGLLPGYRGLEGCATSFMLYFFICESKWQLLCFVIKTMHNFQIGFDFVKHFFKSNLSGADYRFFQGGGAKYFKQLRAKRAEIHTPCKIFATLFGVGGGGVKHFLPSFIIFWHCILSK